jgi:SAM-dependent methyltransferase
MAVRDRLTRDVRKARGAYYTPGYVVDYLLDAALEPALGHGRLPRVLDPACGDGAFLTAAARRLLDRLQPPGADGRLKLLRQCIYGVDVDDGAVEAARRALAALAGCGSPADLAANVCCGDALVGPDFPAGAPAGAFDWAAWSPAASGGFDVIVGNPPYVSFYARGSARPPRALRAYLADRFGAEAGGRLNTYLLFLVQGLRVLRADGRLGMIVPDTLCCNDSYEPLRRRLVERGLCEVSRLEFPVFPGAAVRSALVVLGPRGGPCRLNVFRSRRELLHGAPSEAECAGAADLFAMPRCRWAVGGAAARAILRRMDERGVPLEVLAEVRDGINPGPRSVRRRILDPGGPVRPTWRPVIEGRHVTRYRVASPDGVVDYDPSLLTPEDRRRGASLRDPRLFRGAKLVSRQTADRLIFALDEDEHCTVNSVHNTLARDGRRETLLMLLAVLNSRLLTFYYRLHSQETRRVFPQVHIAALRRLPIAAASPAECSALVRMAEEMIELQHGLAGQGTGREKARDLDHRIDRLVYTLYGMTSEEVRLVESDGGGAGEGG